MSCYEWESGVIKLPSAEYARVKGAIQLAATTRIRRLFNHTQEFWKWIPSKAKNSLELYDKYVIAFVHGNGPTGWNNDPLLPTVPGIAEHEEDRFELAHLLSKVTWEPVPNGTFGTERRRTKPRRVQQKDVEVPTNRTLYYTFGEACITFDPKTKSVRWEVDENNHACERAREHPLAVTLFAALRTVKWTIRTGGEIVGNNEYSRDSRDAGGGANYVVQSFGLPKKSRSRALAYR